MTTTRVLRWYYAATALFLLLDYGIGINVRVAFLEPFPAARAAWYGLCFGCLALMAWRPQWSDVIAATESALVIGALVIGMMTKIMSINESIFLQSGVNFGFEDVTNFMISGSIAYWSWVAALRRLKVRKNSG